MANKRLYRNINDKMLAGVCSGIATYFDLDPSLIRLLWLFFTLIFGTGFLLYIVAWIIIPKKDQSPDDNYTEIK
ncbi:PspC domain-containing protein [Natroniella sp. ANB-PHB2]|uniref:PspC domain-containing protein n=1 Tax=Natroniella sp. ANB-PHB2 TaxID=3384444 RepID=UPI0038D4A2B5